MNLIPNKSIIKSSFSCIESTSMALYVELNHRRRREAPSNLVFAIPRERTQQAILPTHSRFKRRWFQRPGNALCRREAEREAMSFSISRGKYLKGIAI